MMDPNNAQAFQRALAEQKRQLKTGLNQDDIVRCVQLIRAGTSWEDVKRELRIEDQAMEGWRAELERRATLPPGRERDFFAAPVWRGSK